MSKSFVIDGEAVHLSHVQVDGDSVHFELEGKRYTFRGAVREGVLSLQSEAGNSQVYVSQANSSGERTAFVSGSGIEAEARVALPSLRRKSSTAEKGSLKAPMPGMIQKVLVKAGDSVEKGDGLLVMEAMKLQLTIAAPVAGTVEKIYFGEGTLVSEGAELVKLKEDAA